MMILIFDSSRALADRLADLLKEQLKETTVYRATTYKEAQLLLAKHPPDAILLDMKFPGNGAIDLLKHIKKINEKTAALVLYSFVDEFSLTLCKAYGANAFIDKNKDFQSIPSVLRNLLAN
jgi:DNA-binding NarL/FixJ family response regulator